MFDLLSAEYGWTTDNILNCSLHEIYWRLQKIGNRKNSDREFKASLHGLKLEKPKEEMKKSSQALSENEKKALEIALQRAKQRKRLEFSKG